MSDTRSTTENVPTSDNKVDCDIEGCSGTFKEANRASHKSQNHGPSGKVVVYGKCSFNVWLLFMA